VSALKVRPSSLFSRSNTAQGRGAWMPIAGVLLGAGWGSNQFTPMLLVYHARLGLSTSTLEALFGAYAAGLIPGLFLAGFWSDTRGRRGVGVAATGLSLAGTASLIAGGHALGLLFLGRLLAGLGSGAAFGAGTAWLREALVTFNGATPAEVSRRAAIAMTTGFALGPLVAGVLAQWAPAPTVVPYLPHVVLTVAVLAALIGAPETITPTESRRRPGRLPAASARRFRRFVVPVAIWVFVAPAVAFALLPSVVGAGQEPSGVALTAVITSMTALAGVLIQPFARRLEASNLRSAGALVGLLVLAGGLALAALAAAVDETWVLVPCAIVLGSAYGLCLVAGLHEVQRLAPEGSLGALTASYYAVAYIGFASPFLFALAANVAGYPFLLLVASGLAIVTAIVIRQTGPVADKQSA
jgi:hypothetical protein